MAEHQNSPPEMAFNRIVAIRELAKKLSVETGGDPAECIFDLVVAAILVCHEARPMKPPADMVAEIAPHAAAVAEEWFPAFLKAVRTRHG